MENLAWLIPALACPLMMVGMMWVMGKGMGATNRRSEDGAEPDLGELRAERERIDAEIERRKQDGDSARAVARTTPA